MPVAESNASEIEIEWQLDAIDLRPVERWLTTGPAGGSGPDPVTSPTSPTSPLTVSARPRPGRRLVDTYMDTDDWRIGRAGYVLRVRRRTGGADVTMKDRAPATAGLRRRLEVTEPLPSGGINSLGGEGPVGRRLRALAGRRALNPVVEIRTRRRPFDLFVGDDAVAEVALDDTVIEVGPGRAPMRLRRVEIEVAPAWVDTLAPVVEQLRRECGLQPATLSKFEAGMLASGRRVPPPPDLGSTTIPPGPTIGDVAYVVMRRNLAAMLANESGSRLGEDPEDLHDMRVATRRLRAALSLFADVLPTRAVNVREELGWLADLLGAVRDLDVQIERVGEWLDDVPKEDRDALGDLAALLERERAEARDKLIVALDSTRYERLANGFATMLRHGPSRRVPAARVPAITVVPDLVLSRHRAASKAAKRARRSRLPDDFHKLRIRCKRLRYTLEFVSELYDGKPAAFVKQVVRLQDSLGLMQDARVASERLHALATAEDSGLSPTTIFVMGGVAERYRREADKVTRRLPRDLENLGGGGWRKLWDVLERYRSEFGARYGWMASAPGRSASSTPVAAAASRRASGTPPGPETAATEEGALTPAPEPGATSQAPPSPSPPPPPSPPPLPPPLPGAASTGPSRARPSPRTGVPVDGAPPFSSANAESPSTNGDASHHERS